LQDTERKRFQLKVLLQETVEQYSVEKVATQMTDAEIATALPALEAISRALVKDGFGATDIQKLTEVIENLKSAFHASQIVETIGILNDADPDNPDAKVLQQEVSKQAGLIKSSVQLAAQANYQ